MVKSFSQPVLHAEFLADGRTLRISDKIARNLSRQAAKAAELEVQRNAPDQVPAAPALIEVVSGQSSRLTLRPSQLRALKFDDAMFHSILSAISQQQIVVENNSSRPLHVVRHEVIRDLLHAKLQSGWYNGVSSQKSMSALDRLANFNTSSIVSSSAPLQLRSVNGLASDLSTLLAEIINRFISPALHSSIDVTEQFIWNEDISLARASIHCTASECAFRETRALTKQITSKDVSAYGTAPMIFLQGMENGPPSNSTLVESRGHLASLKNCV